MSETGSVVFERTYSRTKPDGTKEDWSETVERVVDGNLALVDERYQLAGERQDLIDLMTEFKILPAGRHLWASGVKNAQHLFNCWVSGWHEKVSDHFAFSFLRLMEGGGVGANYSNRYLEGYPPVQHELYVHVVCDPEHPDYDQMVEQGVLSTEYDPDWMGAFVIEDSREGWAEALVDLIDTFYRDEVGHFQRVYDVSRVRHAGARLKTFGGRASGPLPLARMLIDVCEILSDIYWTPGYQQMTGIDAMKIDHAIAQCVVAGGVRRSARMAMMHWKDRQVEEFINCKQESGSHWTTNISVEVDDEFWEALRDANKSPEQVGHKTCYCASALRILRRISEGMVRNGEPGFWDSSLANKGEPHPVTCTNPCQPAWAPVITKDGISTMGDIQVGDHIWSEDGWVTVERKWSTGVKPVYRYQTTAGHVDATENHRVVQNGSKVELADAESIDRLRGPEVHEIPEIIPQVVMDGLLIGDGYRHKASNGQPFLCVGAKDHDYFDSEVAGLLEPRSNDRRAFRAVSSLTSNDHSERTWDRRIPARYITGSVSERASFLRGLYSANGSVCGGRVTLKATSFGMIQDVQLVLSSLGIASYFTTNKPSKIKWENGVYESKESYDLNIGRATDVRKFRDLIGFIQGYKSDKLDNAAERSAGTRKELSSPIQRREYLGDHEVFDITVSGPSHTYWSGSHNLSNCGEICLEPWEPCNLGHVNLAAFVDAEGRIDTYELTKAHRLMTRFLIRATFSPVGDPKSREVLDRNRRIGVGHLGVASALAMMGIRYSDAPSDKMFRTLLRDLKYAVDKAATEFSHDLRIPVPVKRTTVAPTGTIAKMPGVSEGIHPIFSKYFVRRIRFNERSDFESLAKLVNQGYEYEADLYAPNTAVVSIPTKDSLVEAVEAIWGAEKADEIVESAADLTLNEMLAFQALYQTVWADNAVSFTANVDPEAYTPADVADQIVRFGGLLKGCTVFPEASLPQAPYTRITKEAYESSIAHDVSDGVDPDCSSGSCPVR